jgi:hypothetical protein
MFKFEGLPSSLFQAWDSHSFKCHCAGVWPTSFLDLSTFHFHPFFYMAKTDIVNIQQVRKTTVLLIVTTNIMIMIIRNYQYAKASWGFEQSPKIAHDSPKSMICSMLKAYRP